MCVNVCKTQRLASRPVDRAQAPEGSVTKPSPVSFPFLLSDISLPTQSITILE